MGSVVTGNVGTIKHADKVVSSGMKSRDMNWQDFDFDGYLQKAD